MAKLIIKSHETKKNLHNLLSGFQQNNSHHKLFQDLDLMNLDQLLQHFKHVLQQKLYRLY